MKHYSERESKDWTTSNMKTYIDDCYYYSDRGGECKKSWPDLEHIMKESGLDEVPLKKQIKFKRIFDIMYKQEFNK
jgi:hypothetical protein